MKIKQLFLRNIASIEQAVIRFDEPPLSADPLFLITGETGSGKTTILNAICLALYNTAPNIKSIGTPEEDAEGIQTNNPRQLMRRGTGEALVELTFEGNDGCLYRATWSVQRARRKAEGALQPVRRTLVCESKKLCLQRDSDIRAAIEQEAVGLTYEQFCRTTMLAQGQFSKFMNSEQKDKADILEKLTGTEIYSRIGQRIAERNKEATEAFQALDNQIKGAKLLTEEEKEELRKEIAVFTERHREKEKEYQRMEAACNWLKKMQEHTKNKGEKEQVLATLRTRQQSPEMLAHCRTIALWEETTDIRAALRRERETVKDLSERNETIREKAAQYAHFIKGRNGLQGAYNTLAARREALRIFIEGEAPHRAMYESVGKVEALADRVLNQEAEQQRRTKESTAIQQQLQEMEQPLANARQTAKAAQESYAEQRKKVEVLSKETENIDLKALRQRADDCQNAVKAIEKATDTVRTYHEKKEEAETALQKQKELLQRLSKEEAVRQQQAALLPAVKEKADRLTNQWQGQMDLRNHIVELRNRFHDARTCPLCGSTVAGLHTDELLDTAVAEAKRRADEAKQEQTATENSLRTAEANLKSCKSSLEEAEKETNKRNHAVQAYRTEAETLLRSYDLHADNETVFSALASLKTEADEKAKEANDRYNIALQQITNKEQELRKAGILQHSKEEAEKALQDLERKQEQGQNSLRTCQELIKQTVKEKEEALTELKSLVSFHTDWSNVDVRLLKEHVVRRANTYQQRKKEQEDIAAQAERTLRDIREASEIIEALAPLFLLPFLPDKTEIKELLPLLRNFQNETNRLQGEIRSLKTSLTTVRQEITAYFAQQTSVPRTDVESLLTCSTETIQAYRTEKEQTEQEIHTCEGSLKVLTQQIENMQSDKPKEAESATLEELEQKREQCVTERDEANRQKGASEARIKEDCKRAEELQTERIQLEVLRHTRDNWNELYVMFGKGDNFKKIAQSYILRALLQKANYYLRMLNDRYELDCADGSLTINVIDRHQGGAVRNVGLLSGGEGFIVSLALALGLSVLSKEKMHVDTLFIDEGFGTLSNDYLEVVIHTLDRLHQLGGRKVGVISHVTELAGRIRTQIRLKRTGPSNSAVEVVSD